MRVSLLPSASPRRSGARPDPLLGQALNQILGTHVVALFFTGWQYAGENLTALLRQRDEDLPPPIQVGDALARNTGPESTTILAHGLTQGHREFVSVTPSFPEEGRHVPMALNYFDPPLLG